MKVKRTYHLSRDLVDGVRSLVEDRHAAPSQDALVETAIREYMRRLEDADDGRRWAQAATDAEFQQEMTRLWEEFDQEDRAAWEV